MTMELEREKEKKMEKRKISIEVKEAEDDDVKEMRDVIVKEEVVESEVAVVVKILLKEIERVGALP